MSDAFESYYSFLENGYASYGYAFESDSRQNNEKKGFLKRIKETLQKWCYKMHTTFKEKEQNYILLDYVIMYYDPLDKKLEGSGCGEFYNHMNKQKEINLKTLESFINYLDEMKIANENYYRITYDGIGIYEALKQNISRYA